MRTRVFAVCMLLVAIAAFVVSSSNHDFAYGQRGASAKTSPPNGSLDFVELRSREMKNAGERRGSASSTQIRRSKIPGGWLVTARDAAASSANGDSGGGIGMTFVPDPQHVWDGTSLP